MAYDLETEIPNMLDSVKSESIQRREEDSHMVEGMVEECAEVFAQLE